MYSNFDPVEVHEPNDESLQRAEDWFEDNYDEDLDGIHGFGREDQKGAYVELEENLDLEGYRDFLENEEGYEPDVISDGGGELKELAVMGIEDINGITNRVAVGTTLREGSKVHLGSDNPILQDGTPDDPTVEETLDLAKMYLENVYNAEEK